MARDKGKLHTVLDAIVARLQSQLTLTAATCYLALDIYNVPAPSPGEYLYVVNPLGGGFDEAYLDGGEGNTAKLDCGFAVKIFSSLQRDETGHDTIFLSNASVGLLEKWRLVVKALAFWSPLDGSSNELTRDPIFPTAFSMGRVDKALGDVEQQFSLSLDVDLT